MRLTNYRLMKEFQGTCPPRRTGN